MSQDTRNNRACQACILIACEFSGIVRDAFRGRGYDAISCDLLPSERPGPHYQGNVADLLTRRWGLIIAHPPCTYLAGSGARYWQERQPQMVAALEFVRMLMRAPSYRIAIENPVGAISTHIRKPDQYIQPWQFGHGETKKTGLWLKNLPLLIPTNVVEGREERIFNLSPSKDRWKERSRTLWGVAIAMAEQWGPLI